MPTRPAAVVVLTARGVGGAQQCHVQRPPVELAVAAGRHVRALQRVRAAILAAHMFVLHLLLYFRHQCIDTNR